MGNDLQIENNEKQKLTITNTMPQEQISQAFIPQILILHEEYYAFDYTVLYKILRLLIQIEL